MHIVFEGIDGSGKGTVAQLCCLYFEKQTGGRTFDAISFFKEHGTFPGAHELEGYTVLHTAEPTYAWIGAAIRQEMTRNEARPYSPHAIAEAFALDRLIHYKRLVLPARERGMAVVQERGVMSSLAYQSLTSPTLTVNAIAALEGNTFQLEHGPDYVVVLNLSAEKAMERLRGRTNKKDDSIYEHYDFLRKLEERYASPEARAAMTRGATRIIDFSTNVPLDIMKQKFLDLLSTLT